MLLRVFFSNRFELNTTKYHILALVSLIYSIDNLFVCRYQYVSVSHLRLENYRGSNLIGIIKVHLKVHIGCDECVTRRDV